MSRLEKSKTAKKNIPQDIVDNFIFDNGSEMEWAENLAIVHKDNWCGELDTKGRLVSKFICNSLERYENFYVIGIGQKYGLIDKNGKFIIQPIYDDISITANKRYWIVSSNWGYRIFDIFKDRLVTGICYATLEWLGSDLFLASVDNKFGIIDMYNNIIIPFEYENLEQCYSKDDSSLFFAYKNEKCGIVDISNNIIFPFKYESLYSFGEKTFIAKQKHEAYVIVDEHDNLVCSTVFESIHPCSFGKNEDLYSAQLNGYYGFIDEFGNKKVDFKYADIRLSSSKYAMVSRAGYEVFNDRYGLIDEDENLVLPFEYEYGIKSILKNRFIVRKYGKQGIVNEKNQKITKLIFDHINIWNYSDSDLYYARIGEKAGYIHANTGEPLIIDKEMLDIPPRPLTNKYSKAENLIRAVFCTDD